MKSFFVTIVDVMGILIPGFLFLFGILLLPPVSRELITLESTSFPLPKILLTNDIILIIFFTIMSYIFGFFLRLSSARLLQIITRPFWVKKLALQAKMLNEAMESGLNDEVLCDSIKKVSKTRGKNSPAYYAPYYHFAKRIIRIGQPSLINDAERLEADMRFISGLFIPFFILLIDGFLLAYISSIGIILAIISIFGIIMICFYFPSRRNRLIIYVYYLSLVVLKVKPNYSS